MRVRFAEVAGVLTRYYEAGEGPAVLLLHGVGMQAEVWMRTLPALAERFRVIAPDMLGCGFTGTGAWRDGPVHGPMLEHLAALADSLGLARFAVVGSSLGALFALLLHRAMPERTPSLVLVSSGSAFNDDAGLKAMYQAVWANGRRAYEAPYFDNCVQRLRTVLGPDAEVPEALVYAQMTSYALPGALEAFNRRLQALSDVEAWRPWRVQPHLGDVRADVLAVFGGRDPRANVEVARAELARIPRSRLSVYENARHYPQLEEPERFNRDVGEFLERSLMGNHA